MFVAEPFIEGIHSLFSAWSSSCRPPLQPTKVRFGNGLVSGRMIYEYNRFRRTRCFFISMLFENPSISLNRLLSANLSSFTRRSSAKPCCPFKVEKIQPKNKSLSSGSFSKVLRKHSSAQQALFLSPVVLFSTPNVCMDNALIRCVPFTSQSESQNGIFSM